MTFFLSLAVFLCQSTEETPMPIITSPATIFFQAHRGGVDEVPENTLAALEHAWSIPGAVPEVDLQTTQDGAIVCLHDDTPARTTNAPAPWRDKPLREIPLAEVRQWDAGLFFGESYRGEKVPTLTEVFDAMKKSEDRQIYLDMKEVDTGAVLKMIKTYGFQPRILFVHGEQAACLELSRLYEGAWTMTWISGSPSRIRQRYETLRASGFEGISQLQFHLQVKPGDGPIAYVLEDEFLREAAKTLREAGKELQLRPFKVDATSLARLIDCGVHWYVTDAPAAFYRYVKPPQ